MDELDKCPCCQSTNIDATDNDKPVYCKDCGLRALTVTAWNTRAPVTVTDETVEVKISIHGCDDSTHLTRRMTKDQFTFLKKVAEQISAKSEYGCMPVMGVALTAALGGDHG